jgi:hypothetical protein
MVEVRTYRPGESLEDYCRACKTDRMHTIVVLDAAGLPLRVACGYCHSEHNYRGGPRIAAAPLPGDESPAPPPRGAARPSAAREPAARRTSPDAAIISERERSAPPMSPDHSQIDLEMLLRRVIREEAGITPVAPAEKWRGGQMILRPGRPGVQEKSWPIETFFHKVVMLRNRLRTLEQQVNASDLADDVKVRLQAYVSGCYGTLTSFNVLFADEDDQFKGSGGD